MIKNINDGGLNMIKIDKFIMGLKVTWLRRVLTNNENCTWGRLSKIDFSKLFEFGDGYAEQKAQDLQNPFWKDLLQGWKTFIRSSKIENLTKMLYSPIWFNSNLNRGSNLFIKNWLER